MQGTVVDAKKAGALSGQRRTQSRTSTALRWRRHLSRSNTQLWQRQGRDKSASTVNSAIGLGALGAIFGGIAGGGAGAAIGAAAGAGVGVAGSASSPGGRVIVPPEAVITFQLAQPAVVKTVSEQEMARLAYSAGPNPQHAAADASLLQPELRLLLRAVLRSLTPIARSPEEGCESRSPLFLATRSQARLEQLACPNDARR